MTDMKDRLPKSASVLFDNRRFTITMADIRTPTTFYPIGDTVGRVRRDILFGGLAYSAVTGAALLIYHDLWRAHEALLMVLSITLALVIGCQVSVLQLDARGFPPRMFVARSKTVRAVFDAITLARAKTAGTGSGFEPDDDGDES